MDKRGKVTEAKDDGPFPFQFRCWLSRVKGDNRLVESPAAEGACGYLFQASTRKQATARGDEHLAEHDGADPVELVDSKASA